MPRVKGILSQKIKTNKNLDERNELLLKSLVKFYDTLDISVYKKINDIINSQDEKINLKLIEYFLNTYSKNRNIIIAGEHIHSSYKTLLKTYSKSQFEIFRRGDKILFKRNNEGDREDNSTNILVTTTAQLNIFKWLTQYGVIEYLYKNCDIILQSLILSSED